MTSQRQPRRRRPAKAKRRSSQDTNGREGRTVAEGSRQEGASRPATSSTKAAGTEINNGGFSTLGLSSTTLQAVNQAGYSQPTPVQSGVIPRAIAGIDVLGQAQTGTGKTASFVLPILELLTRSSGRGHGVRALVLVPTRELAVQVRDEFEKLAAGSKLRCVAVYGGKPIKSQIDKLARNPQVVVGTPGRVLDHMSRGTLVLSDLELVTLDEADRMLDIGFRPDIEKILRRCPQSRQTLLLSATVPPPVAKLATRYMRDPEVLDFSTKEISVETIEQFYFTVDPSRKFALLEQLLEREQPRQAIVFCRTKRGTDKINERLQRRRKEKKTSVACIHGDLAQNVRDRVMRQFREGQIEVLVATDVVGRGIDVSGVSHIINYDIPEFCDDYVHRVGRTGRMGREGVAYTFVAPEEGTQLTRIEMRIDKLLERSEIAGFSALDPKPTATPLTNEQQVRDGKDFGGSVGEASAAPKPTPSLLGRKRGPKRFRRAL